LNDNDLLVRPGDSLASPVWAVLTTAGYPFSLAGWDVLAQIRSNVLDPAVFQECSTANGKILVDTTTVTSRITGAPIDTSSVQLVLSTTDTANWPRMWFGVYDVRIYKADPAARFTVVPTARFYVVGTSTE
jgi:hypothetical protein